jgi:peptidoglycan/LPS O-acetylase OafA/YrhL
LVESGFDFVHLVQERERASSGAARAHTYRPEIDGLRALAVVPVILFHTGSRFFSGGFVGVDVFFVISGFLITSIIIEERETGFFSIAGFYERRARRILPALYLVMLVCIPVAWIWMLPRELENFGQSLVAVSLFVSNILFWRTGGYFNVPADQKPLLHTWSLGVEEQFYLIFPLLIACFWRFGIKWLVSLLVLGCVASFLMNDWMLSSHSMGAFFLAPMRAWELAAGALLCFTRISDSHLGAHPRAIREGFAAIGLALILVPISLYGVSTPFPGRYALPPVIGTLLVLYFAGTRTLIGRLLASPVLLWLGGISYAAYLWHQPLFAFARLINASRPSSAQFAALAILAVGIAAISSKFIERPFRDRRNWSRRAILVWSVLPTLVFIGVGVGFVAGRGMPNRWSEHDQALLMPAKAPFYLCPAIDSWLRVCRIGAPGRVGSVVLLGDSHADAIWTALSEALARENRTGYLVRTDCFPIGGIFDDRQRLSKDRREHCAEVERRVREFVGRGDVTTVIVAVRWTLQLYPMNDEIDAPGFNNQEGGVEDVPYRESGVFDANGRWTEGATAKAEALCAYISGFAALKRTVLLYPTPEVGWTPERLNLAALVLGKNPPHLISTSWIREQQRNSAADRVLDSIDSPNIRRVRPEDIFCNALIKDRCVVQAGDALYYADDNHVSMQGARLIVQKLLPQLASK